MDQDRPTAPKLGRPTEERLAPEHVAWLKAAIQRKFKVLRRFYEKVYSEAKKHEYAIYERPTSENSVARAFAFAFNGQRSLPDLFQVVLCVLLEINEDALPWKKKEVRPDLGLTAAPQGPAPETPPASVSSSLVAEFPTRPPGTSLNDKLTPELFTRLTTPEIKGHIVAALMETRAPNSIAETELLLPETTGILAEKLVHEPVENFVDFYAGDYDSPPKIKRAVAAVIAANPVLRAELAVKVARSGYSNLVGWFQVFSSFCAREVVVEVEHAFLEFSKEPAFQEGYGLCVGHGSSTLISAFSKFGCVAVVQAFKER